MEKDYNRKRVTVFFDFDNQGNVIADSKFVGVTYFDENNQKSESKDRSGSLALYYNNMTKDQKDAFDVLVESYMNVKDQTN
jgi:hypothetical protein